MSNKKQFLLELADLMDKYGVLYVRPFDENLLAQSKDWYVNVFGDEFGDITTTDIRQKTDEL